MNHLYQLLLARTQEQSPLIQILLGPRQVGKTTALLEVAKHWGEESCVLGSADERQLLGNLWIEQMWEKARRIRTQRGREVLLILDEIQKIEQWSETVKKLWDEDVRNQNKIKVILSGSSALSIQSGLSESLAGRFENIPATHFSWTQFQKLTKLPLDHFIFFGGYPGSYQFLDQEDRWRSYITDSIVESILSRDIMLLTKIEKPAILRRLFQLGCEYSGQILSYQKALGQLQDRGNTTTLAHYLELLHKTYVLTGLQKFELRPFKLRGSSPKFQVYNTALMGALGGYKFADAKHNSAIWGRYIESAVGAHLLNQQRLENFELSYWREGNEEVDFVVKKGPLVLAIEVKSGIRGKLSGLKKFKSLVPKSKAIVLESSDIEGFLSATVI